MKIAHIKCFITINGTIFVIRKKYSLYRKKWKILEIFTKVKYLLVPLSSFGKHKIKKFRIEVVGKRIILYYCEKEIYNFYSGRVIGFILKETHCVSCREIAVFSFVNNSFDVSGTLYKHASLKNEFATQTTM